MADLPYLQFVYKKTYKNNTQINLCIFGYLQNWEITSTKKGNAVGVEPTSRLIRPMLPPT